VDVAAGGEARADVARGGGDEGGQRVGGGALAGGAARVDEDRAGAVEPRRGDDQIGHAVAGEVGRGVDGEAGERALDDPVVAGLGRGQLLTAGAQRQGQGDGGPHGAPPPADVPRSPEGRGG